MTDWDDVPTFGRPASPGAATIRPSAYGLIADDHGRLAVVHSPLGLCLPGGGSDDGEDAAETVAREVREECALVVELGQWRRRAVEHVYSLTEKTLFEKRCTFCDGRAIGVSDNAPEADHVMEWMPAADAAARVVPLSHRWAIDEWLEIVATAGPPS